MPTLPGSGTLTQGLEIQEEPSLTWIADKEKNRIVGVANGLPAIRQAVDIITQVERFRWQIYTPFFGMDWDGLVGMDPGYVASELHRRLSDAFSMDSRILGITDFTYQSSGDVLTANFTVQTVYGQLQQGIEVIMS